jgi:hypothetical protein
MAISAQSEMIEYHTDHVERLVLGMVFVLLGAGALAFWNVEQSTQWPLVLVLMIGILFIGLGLFMIGFRRSVRLEGSRGVSERRSLFGITIATRRRPMTDFECVGCRISAADLVSWDVALFMPGGGCIVLRAWVSNFEEVQQEITRVEQSLGLPAQREPRIRTYIVGP